MGHTGAGSRTPSSDEHATSPAAVDEQAVSGAADDEHAVASAADDEHAVASAADDEHAVASAADDEHAVASAADDEHAVASAADDEHAVTSAVDDGGAGTGARDDARGAGVSADDAECEEVAAARGRDRRAARLVTYGVVGVILLGAAAEIEAWPVTSFRLFSTVRTANGATTSLVAIAADGTQTPVRIPGQQVLATTSHQLVELRGQSPRQQRAEAVAWLQLAGLDPRDFVAVAVDRSSWTQDPETLEREVRSTTRLVEVQL